MPMSTLKMVNGLTTIRIRIGSGERLEDFELLEKTIAKLQKALGKRRKLR
jgi:hypothetical protein